MKSKKVIIFLVDKVLIYNPNYRVNKEETFAG